MKIAKNSSRINPLVRVMAGAVDVPSSIGESDIMRITRDDRMTSGISLDIMLFDTKMGRTVAVMPIITRMLKILLPTTLPTASSPFPPAADIMLIASSGAEVPNATTVSPTTRSEIPILRAMAEEPSVSQLAPKRIRARPPIRNKMLKNIWY